MVMSPESIAHHDPADRAAIFVAAAARTGPYIYSVQLDRLSRVYP
jgi:hypothetical protein